MVYFPSSALRKDKLWIYVADLVNSEMFISYAENYDDPTPLTY